jgi:hypothetical protein
MLFIFSTPVLIRHLWQLKTVDFLHWCLMRVFPLDKFHSFSGEQCLTRRGGDFFSTSSVFRELTGTGMKRLRRSLLLLALATWPLGSLQLDIGKKERKKRKFIVFKKFKGRIKKSRQFFYIFYFSATMKATS